MSLGKTGCIKPGESSSIDISFLIFGSIIWYYEKLEIKSEEFSYI